VRESALHSPPPPKLRAAKHAPPELATMDAAMASASAGEEATCPFGTDTPCCRISSMPMYSCTFSQRR
jgi:hypothetical protein